jgi:VanZ family protein
LKRTWAAAACTLLFFAVGSLPAGPGVSQDSFDKVLHAIGFGVLAGLWCSSVRELRPRLGALHWALAGFLSSSALGGLLELWQALIGYRSCELLDWVADIAGALCVAAAYWAYRARGRGHAAPT